MSDLSGLRLFQLDNRSGWVVELRAEQGGHLVWRKTFVSQKTAEQFLRDTQRNLLGL